MSCDVANIYSNLQRTFGDGFLPSEMLLLDSEDTLLNMNPPVNLASETITDYAFTENTFMWC